MWILFDKFFHNLYSIKRFVKDKEKKTCIGISFLIKLQPAFFRKTQNFEIFQENRFLIKDLWMVASASSSFLQCHPNTCTKSVFNPFSTNVRFLYPMKTSENRRTSDVFRGYRSGILVENELNQPNSLFPEATIWTCENTNITQSTSQSR